MSRRERLIMIGLLTAGFLLSSSNALATVRSKARTLRIVAGSVARTVRLAGSGPHLRLNSVRVNGHELTMGEGNGSHVATMYGEGVVVRFLQHRNTYSASVVAISGHPLVRISYFLGR
jgi:hypothetical protein